VTASQVAEERRQEENLIRFIRAVHRADHERALERIADALESIDRRLHALLTRGEQ
jgi:hypothetical protein